MDQQDRLIDGACSRLRRTHEQQPSAEKDNGDKRQSKPFRHVCASSYRLVTLSIEEGQA
jgi:hypothetical protein